MDKRYPKFRPNPRHSDQSLFGPRPPKARRAPKPRKPAGPALHLPKDPASGKQRRRMLKATAWRLAKLLRLRPASLLSMEDASLRDLIERNYRGRGQGGERDQARQLLKKIGRLRFKA